MKEEIWKPIKDYEGLYEISSHGRVKSLAKRWNTNGQGARWKDESYLIAGDSSGYKRIVLSKDSIKKTFSIHVLVASAFCENAENYPIVNHKNSIRWDNYFENLEWTTYKGNAIHAFKNGNRKGMKGERHPNSKYCERDIRIIRKLYADKKYNQSEIAAMFSDVESNIGRIISGKRWSHIT